MKYLFAFILLAGFNAHVALADDSAPPNLQLEIQQALELRQRILTAEVQQALEIQRRIQAIEVQHALEVQQTIQAVEVQQALEVQQVIEAHQVLVAEQLAEAYQTAQVQLAMKTLFCSQALPNSVALFAQVFQAYEQGKVSPSDLILTQQHLAEVQAFCH